MISIQNDSDGPVKVRVRLADEEAASSSQSTGVNIPIGGEPVRYNIDEFLIQQRAKEREQNALELDKKDPEYIIKAMAECRPAVIRKYASYNGKDIYVADAECKNGELKEHYYILEGNKFAEYENDNGTLRKSSKPLIKPSKLVEAVENAAKAKEASEVTSDAYSEFLEGNMGGGKLFEKINGATEDRNYHRINKTLKNLDKDNVVGFLSSYYDKSKYNGKMEDKDGLLEWLDEEYDGGVVEMDNKKNAVKALLEKAKELGLDKCEEYLDIVEIMSDYGDDGAYENAENFRGSSWKGSKGRNFAIGVGDTAAGTGIGATIGAGIGAAVSCIGSLLKKTSISLDKVKKAAKLGAKIGAWIGGVGSCIVHHTQVIWRWGWAGKRTDSEYLDEAMFNLHKKILEKIGG